jgi:hypothetical protein
MVQVLCARCGKEFYGKPSHIALGYNKYCSRGCHFLSMRKGKWFKCDGCGVDIYRTPKYIRASKSKKYFCNKSCQTKWRNSEFSGKRHANWQHGRGSYRNIMQRAGIDAVCSLCMSNDERVMVVHHKDQNRTNNAIDNLIWLCRNCHYLVHQYPVGREKGLIV